jgi:hypothetical protein
MDQVLTPQRKALVVRGTQMLVIGVMMNIGVTIIGFLALVQFFWMMFASERNSSVTDLGVNISEWCSTAIGFMLGTSDQKAFPWKNI